MTKSKDPKQWSVRELQRSRMFQFQEQVFHENSFSVFFSNQGTDRKADPLYNRRREKGGQQKRSCSAISEKDLECKQETSSPFGVCKTHKKEILEKHTADWVGHFIPPSDLLSKLDTQARNDIQSYEKLLIPMHGWLIERLLLWSKLDTKKKDCVNLLMQKIAESIPGRIPDATSLQETFLMSKPEWATPNELVSFTRKTIDDLFPHDVFSDEYVQDCVFASKPKQRKLKDKRTSPLSIEIPKFPIRAIAALVFLAMIAEETNRGDAWFRKTYNLGEPERAGAHFAYTIYVLRREGRMSIKQISKLLQIPPWE